MLLSGFDQVLWAVTFAAHLLLLAVLVVRGRAATFPVFTTLIAFYAARTVALYLILHRLTQRDYFYSYWSMAAVDEVLQVGVFYELAKKVFCPAGVWARDIRRAFVTLIGASAVVACFLTWLADPATSFRVQAVVLRGNLFDSVLMSELFVGMMVLSSTAGLPWKTHVARIAQGLGAYSMLCVGTRAAESYFGVAQDTYSYMTLSRLRILMYAACAGYWMVTLWRDAPAPRELPEAMRMQIYTLQRRVEYDLVRIRAWRRS